MAEQLQSFKKILTKKYIKTGTTPVFTGELEKLRGHWDAFVEYKSSELGLQKVQKAKDNASKKVYHHTLGQGGYKLAVPKWEKMEQDLLDRGIQPATMNWPERSRTWFYGHGGSLDPLTGDCVYGPNIQRAAQRLQEAIQAAAEGTFKPDRERDELTYALGNPEHPGRTRGKGVVPWKYGFRDYIESYRSRQRRKNDEREHLRRLEERLMSHDQRLEEEVQRQVAVAMSQQQQAQTLPPEPSVAADHLSQRKSSCASTDVAAAEPTGIQAAVEASAPQRFPVDEITHRTPCDLQTAVKNLMFTVAYGTAMPTEPGDVYHGQQIPPRYTRVGVEQVCQGWETLELDIPGGDGERTLAEAIHGYILWDKRYIVLKSDDQTPRPASQHASPRPASPQNSPRAALSRQGSPAHSPSPSSHAPMNTQASPSPPWSPPPPPAKKQKRPPAKKVAAPAREPPKKKEKKKKTKEAPIKPWDMSLEECDRITQERVKEHFKPKPKPEPEKVINPIDLKFFKGMCEANKRKFIPRDPPSDYERTIIKTTEKKKRQSKSSSSDVPQLGAQKKQSIEPLVVGQTTQEQDFVTFLKESNLTAAQIAGGEDIPKADVVVKWTFEIGKTLVPPEVVSVLPTQMYKLHQHYMRAMADCIFMQGAKIKDDDFLRGEAILWINWEEIYQLFHQEALDISMVALWVL